MNKEGHAMVLTSTPPSSLAEQAEGQQTLESKAWINLHWEGAPLLAKPPNRNQQVTQQPLQKVTQT